ncbi:MAG: SAM-dependent chlorinase/fluorinase, partial [candidate division WOR-3 bacterium]|nr:SAM-dependent chlorinase/fluorinase [candidate division WOR-3 bacterium]
MSSEKRFNQPMSFFFLTFCSFRIIIHKVRIYDMQPNSIITLITDFGNTDDYVGVMKGVMLSVNPDLRFTDITHSIPPQDIKKAAFILYKAYKYFPEGTVHLVVVDPGVGSKRNPIIVETEKYFFVAPDNGVLSLVLTDKSTAYKITNGKPES